MVFETITTGRLAAHWEHHTGHSLKLSAGITVSLTIDSMRAVIFDMDGVLVDSEPVYMRRFLQFMQEHGVPLDPQAYRKTVGWSSAMTWEWALSQWPEATTVTNTQAKYRAYWKGQTVRYDEVLDPDVLPCSEPASSAEHPDRAGVILAPGGDRSDAESMWFSVAIRRYCFRGTICPEQT